jgi:DNA-binding ferritin-like protein
MPCKDKEWAEVKAKLRKADDEEDEPEEAPDEGSGIEGDEVEKGRPRMGPYEKALRGMFSKGSGPFEKAVAMYGARAPMAADASCAKLMTELLGRLKALFWSHWSSHWQSRGASFYGDHELFSRLYDDVKGEIDQVAERAVGYHGIEAVDPLAVARHERENMTASPDLVGRALAQERAFMTYLDGMIEQLKARGKYTAGLEDLLPEIASTHDGHLYLLQQRQGL